MLAGFRSVHQCSAGDGCQLIRDAQALLEAHMAIHSVVLDGTRHVDNNGFTRCGKLIAYGTPWQEDPLDGSKAEGKLCKTCYATVDAEEEAAAAINAEHDADGHVDEQKTAVADANAKTKAKK